MGRRKTGKKVQRAGRSRGRRRNWDRIVGRLNSGAKERVSVRMGSPGSAQVTRRHLLSTWSNLHIWISGEWVHLELK